MDGGGAEVVGVGFHGEAVDAYDVGVFGDDVISDEPFAGVVGLDDGFDEVLRDGFVVGQELFGVFGEAVAAIAEGGVVVVSADARVKADSVDDAFGVEAFGGGVSVEFVEVGNAEGEVSISEELDGLGFGAVHEEDGSVFFLASVKEEAGEGFGLFCIAADDDAGGVEVVVEGFAFAEEFGGEKDVLYVIFFFDAVNVANRDGGFDDHGDFMVFV